MRAEKYSNEYMHLLTKKLNAQHIITNCVNCVNFNSEFTTCNLCNLRPPIQVIATGCPMWEPTPF